jgi:hypothetical protein
MSASNPAYKMVKLVGLFPELLGIGEIHSSAKSNNTISTLKLRIFSFISVSVNSLS